MRKNICVIGLEDNFINLISKELADKFKLMYANIEELLQYELLDLGEVEKINGIEYVLNKEWKLIKQVSGYEKVLLSLKYGALTNKDNYKNIQKNCIIIYVRFTKMVLQKMLETQNIPINEMEIANKLFDSRDKFCKKLANIIVTIPYSKKNNALELILNSVNEYKKG